MLSNSVLVKMAERAVLAAEESLRHNGFDGHPRTDVALAIALRAASEIAVRRLSPSGQEQAPYMLEELVPPIVDLAALLGVR